MNPIKDCPMTFKETIKGIIRFSQTSGENVSVKYANNIGIKPMIGRYRLTKNKKEGKVNGLVQKRWNYCCKFETVREDICDRIPDL